MSRVGGAAGLAGRLALAALASAGGCAGAPGKIAACPRRGEVDRIEGRVAVVVRPDGGTVDCAATGLAEGDVLVDGRVDAAATARLARDVARLRARLSAADDGGDLEL